MSKPTISNEPLRERGVPKVRAELRAAVSLLNGSPVLTERYHTAPLKIAKAFSLQDEAGPQLGIVQMDVSPGLLDGDEYEYDWTADENCRLYVTNQAYTRVHPSSGAGATVRQRLRLGRSAVLEWMPEPVMLFKGASYSCVTDIELSAGSVCLFADVLCPGRVARGESFEYEAYDSRLTVRYEGELVHYQRQRYVPAHLPLKSPGCFGSYSHLGSLAVFSDRADAETATRIREILELERERESMEADGGGDLAWEITQTARYGIVVMMAGTRTWQLQSFMQKAWDIVRKEMLGVSPLRLFKDNV